MPIISLEDRRGTGERKRGKLIKPNEQTPANGIKVINVCVIRTDSTLEKRNTQHSRGREGKSSRSTWGRSNSILKTSSDDSDL